jgi:hypothetical protein
MNADRLAELNKILSQPLRQKILLQLGQYDSLTFESLLKNLKIEDPQELSNQMQILCDLLERKNEQEHSSIEQEHLEKSNEKYVLTEKGHDVLYAMISFPELKSKYYKQKLKPKWFTPYWVSIFASTVVIIGVVIPVFGHHPFETAIFYLAIALTT